MTNGEENASREWTIDAVKGLIEQKEKEGAWTFVFLGAAPGAWAQGRAYGIPAANVAQYSAGRYQQTFAAVSLGTNAVAASPRLRSKSLLDSVSKEILRKAGLRRVEEKS